ncbi:MAG TPA: hypothetical protein VFN27_10690 [Xanthobacteraceae bacterium]|nr:hypothetical protein [Xanthobacteraceae bacterium]
MARAFALWVRANLPKLGVIHRFRPLAHDPKKWIPVSRLREALVKELAAIGCFGGRSQVGKIMRKTKAAGHAAVAQLVQSA